jgi:uncharacterized protein YdbL (DUF1318 family)
MAKTDHMNRRRFLFSLAGLLAAAALAKPALAQDLDSLRREGKVGERYDGYAVARDSSVRGFVDQINAKRREVYINAAASAGATVEATGKIYFQENLPRLPQGTYIQLEDGSWVQK